MSVDIILAKIHLNLSPSQIQAVVQVSTRVYGDIWWHHLQTCVCLMFLHNLHVHTRAYWRDAGFLQLVQIVETCYILQTRRFLNFLSSFFYVIIHSNMCLPSAAMIVFPGGDLPLSLISMSNQFFLQCMRGLWTQRLRFQGRDTGALRFGKIM